MQKIDEMRLSGHTSHFAVLGHPIGHTLSPVMHNASFRSLGLDAVYLAFDVQPARLMSVLLSMADMGFRGVNLTVPLKEAAFQNLSQLDQSAANLGAVNTVEFLDNGEMKGYNTDGEGFLMALKEVFGVDVEGKSLFILGSGGAGRALAITSAVNQAKSIAVTDLIEERTQKLVEEIKGLRPEVKVSGVAANKDSWKNASLAADMVIQATPVGMKKEDAPLLESDAFKKGQMVYDLVYMYPETAFLSQAKKAGALVSNGLGMLLHQGARAFTIWTGQTANVSAMRQTLENSVYR